MILDLINIDFFHFNHFELEGLFPSRIFNLKTRKTHILSLFLFIQPYFKKNPISKLSKFDFGSSFKSSSYFLYLFYDKSSIKMVFSRNSFKKQLSNIKRYFMNLWGLSLELETKTNKLAIMIFCFL